MPPKVTDGLFSSSCNAVGFSYQKSYILNLHLSPSISGSTLGSTSTSGSTSGSTFGSISAFITSTHRKSGAGTCWAWNGIKSNKVYIDEPYICQTDPCTYSHKCYIYHKGHLCFEYT
ncbi:hypothetical protein BC936DRAFT_142885 [Jimgerdemannia flammicorona]|uniref:Uncharacterized protein n=1 Tax=Jimgerdemannia flammicorona TaxID=994334 RepID=A0A433DEP7_9FUNG|nr:hypothetical protein BC936DRAFT_142885 [Jimgerdemannia flammicorona]